MSDVVSVVTFGLVDTNKAAKEQKRANRKAARIEALRGARERAQALRQNRIQSAELFASAAAGGVEGSSGVQGALAGFETGAAAQAGFSQQIDALQQERLRALGRADVATARAQFGQTVGGLALKVAGGAVGG